MLMHTILLEVISCPLLAVSGCIFLVGCSMYFQVVSCSL